MKTASRFSLSCSLILICLVAVFTSPVFAQMPDTTSVMAITYVDISGDNGSYKLTINGSGFGSPTGTLPYTGNVSNFRIGDAALGQPPAQGDGEWGYTGDNHVLTYYSWSDHCIVVSGMGGSAGDAITLAVWNASTGQGVTWSGNLPRSVRITRVAHSGTGANLQLKIYGSGFGAAPIAMPYTGDLNYFEFTDFRTHCDGAELFNAGFENWGVSPNSVTLKYQSWSDTEIVINGFAGAYDTGCYTYQVGDPVGITVWSTSDSSITGAQTAWSGNF